MLPSRTCHSRCSLTAYKSAILTGVGKSRPERIPTLPQYPSRYHHTSHSSESQAANTPQCHPLQHTTATKTECFTRQRAYLERHICVREGCLCCVSFVVCVHYGFCGDDGGRAVIEAGLTLKFYIYSRPTIVYLPSLQSGNNAHRLPALTEGPHSWLPWLSTSCHRGMRSRPMPCARLPTMHRDLERVDTIGPWDVAPI